MTSVLSRILGNSKVVPASIVVIISSRFQRRPPSTCHKHYDNFSADERHRHRTTLSGILEIHIIQHEYCIQNGHLASHIVRCKMNSISHCYMMGLTLVLPSLKHIIVFLDICLLA